MWKRLRGGEEISEELQPDSPFSFKWGCRSLALVAEAPPAPDLIQPGFEDGWSGILAALCGERAFVDYERNASGGGGGNKMSSRSRMSSDCLRRCSDTTDKTQGEKRRKKEVFV